MQQRVCRCTLLQINLQAETDPTQAALLAREPAPPKAWFIAPVKTDHRLFSALLNFCLVEHARGRMSGARLSVRRCETGVTL